MYYGMFVLLLIAMAQTFQDMTFQQYMKQYQKLYAPSEKAFREQIYRRRMVDIIYQNSLSTGWKAGINQFTDRTDEELRAMLGTRPGIKPGKAFSLKSDLNRRYPNGDMPPRWKELPFHVDWREKNIITAV